MSRAVTSVPWQDIGVLLAPEPGARQQLEGFDPGYVDIVDYIVRCTHRIWEGRQLDLIRTHYTDECVVHTLAGETRGVQAVVNGTLAVLQAFPDRTLYADQVIWSHEPGEAYYSSHRITSHMTHLGANELGPPRGRRATITTIADCAVRANRIYEEWLVRDNYALLLQLGVDPEHFVRAQALRDREDGATREMWARESARTRAAPATAERRLRDTGEPAVLAREIFGAGWNARALDRLAERYSPVCEWQGPGGRRLFGRAEIAGFAEALLAAIPDAVVSIDHIASVPFLDLGTDIAVRWSLAGTHSGPGLHGAPTGLPVYLLAVSHWRLLDGLIAEEWLVFDEIALLRQLRQNVPP